MKYDILFPCGIVSFLEKNPAIRNKLSGKMRNISLAPDDNLEGDGTNK